MSELNDVVRHVILRILVDQAGLAEELAAARAKLKALKDAEAETNKARGKSADEVTAAYGKQNKALEENAKAHEAAKRAAAGEKTAAEQAKAQTNAIKDDTRGVHAVTAATGNEQRKDANAEAQRKRADENAAADRVRLDENAAHAREIAERRATSAIETAQEASDQRIAAAQQTHEERLRSLREKNEQSLITQTLSDLEKIAELRRRSADAEETRVEKLRELQRKNAYAEDFRARIAPADIEASVARSQSVAEIAGAKTDVAQSQAQVAAARALNEEDKTNTAIAERRNVLSRNEERFRSDIAKVAAQTNVLDQRGAEIKERRERAAERAATSRRRSGSISGGISGLVSNVARIPATLLFGAPDNSRLDNAVKSLRSVRSESGGAKAALGAFFASFRSGEHEAVSVLDHLGSRFTKLVELFKPASSGGGGLIGNIFGNIGDIGNGFTRVFDNMGKHLFSFQSLIIVVIAALGPLAAILGAVGAAALGLASNLGALVGVFAALPGIIGAAVAGFGALAIVMKPLANVFSAFSAAQKEATSTTNAATTAALNYKDAVLQQQEAEIAYRRALQDGPRLQTALNDARKQATRDIEDYRTALRKLKFDEEGAQLGVESAEQQARRAMADPTASSLDRRQALHNVQGALFDQQDQATKARRTREDAAEAFRKGVEGADSVVAAERAVEDQTYKIQEAYIAWQKSIIAVNKAAAEKAAGGSAAAEYQRQLDKLPPLTRKVAQAVIDLIKVGGPFEKLRNTLSENIFGPLSANTGKFKDLLDELGTYLAPASKAIGTLAKNAIDLLTSPEWKAFFSQSGTNSAAILTKLGQAALSVADAFRGIITAAAPFTSFLVGTIGKLADDFDRWANSAKGQNAIKSFLDTTAKRLQEIGPIFKEIAIGVAGFFTALNTPDGAGHKDFTTRFNSGLLTIATNFAKLGQQAADPNSGFRKWLDRVIPLLKEVGHFLGAAITAIGKLFADPRNMNEAEGLLKNLATKWLPRLAEIFSDLSESGVVSKLAAAIGAVFGVVKAFFDHGGLTAFKFFADVLGAVATAIDWLTQHVPILSSLLGALGFVITAALGAALIAKLTGIQKIIDTIRKSVGGVKVPGGGSRLPGTTSGAAGTASAVEGGEELVVLRRMEIYLRQIALNTGGVGNIPDNTTIDEDGKKRPKGYKGSRRAGSAAARDAEEVVEDAAKGAGKGGIVKRILRRLGGDAGSVGLGVLAGGGAEVAGDAAVSAVQKSATKSATSSATKSAATEAVEDVAKTGLKSGLVGNLAKGAIRGLPGIVATVAAQVGGALLVDKFVKNDKDKASLNKGLGTVASWGSTGALLGSVIPGLGTVAGGVIGGVAGGIKAYATDPNLRKFVNKKVGSFAESTVNTVKDLAGGKDAGVGGALALASGPIGLLASKTDIGKSIIESLNHAGGKVGQFFTKTIPDLFHKGVQGIVNFFTKTLPSLPGKFFDFFFVSVGRILRFFGYTLPKAAAWVFTDGIPRAVTAGWRFLRRILIDPFIAFIQAIPGFFTKTIPHWFGAARHWVNEHVSQPLYAFIRGIPDFFTKTIPHWFAQAPAWFKKHVVDNVTHFFTVQVPAFFTTTLPNAIKGLPGFLYDHLVQPILDFFSGLGRHIGDFLTGSWDWVKGLFSRAGSDIQQGAQGKMSGGLVMGVYQGVEDTVRLRATPDEFVMRRSKVMEPGAKAILTDWNEGRLQVADLYKGLSRSAAPQVMAMVPPDAGNFTNRVPTIVNNTVNHAPVMGDVTINNPVREKSEATLRRQIHIAAIRHRR